MNYEENPKSIKYHVKMYLHKNKRRFHNKSFIDFPAGNGITTKILKEIGAKPLAFDLFPEYFNIPGLDCKRANIVEGLPVEDACSDYLICQEGIEHFSDQLASFKEFNRVLVDDGYLLITCPDLKNVSKYVAEDKLLEPLYESPAGPITPLDIMFGHRGSIQNGNTFMAHKCGFTMNVLVGLLNNCGFKSSVGAERANYFDIWAIGYKNIEILPEQSTKLLKEHLGIKEENIEFN